MLQPMLNAWLFFLFIVQNCIGHTTEFQLSFHCHLVTESVFARFMAFHCGTLDLPTHCLPTSPNGFTFLSPSLFFQHYYFLFLFYLNFRLLSRACFHLEDFASECLLYCLFQFPVFIDYCLQLAKISKLIAVFGLNELLLY